MAHRSVIQAAAGPTRCPYAFSSGSRSRAPCVLARAAASQAPLHHSSSSNSSSSNSRISRRQLISSTTAAAVAWLIFGKASPAAADEADAVQITSGLESTVEVAAAEPAATAATEAEPAISQKVTDEGLVKLMTDEQATRNMTPTDRQIFSLNRRVQAQNRAPVDFPGFIREGFDITVVGEGYVMDADGLIYKDFVEGSGPTPADGQQVVFDYTAYNESGAIIDSSYRKGQAAQTRLGIQGLIPGFELGIKGMKPGGKRRIVVPPALGPPVGPSTFFSAKQCEVFDVELRKVQKCERRQMMMFSDVVCE